MSAISTSAMLPQSFKILKQSRVRLLAQKKYQHAKMFKERAQSQIFGNDSNAKTNVKHLDLKQKVFGWGEKKQILRIEQIINVSCECPCYPLLQLMTPHPVLLQNDLGALWGLLSRIFESLQTSVWLWWIFLCLFHTVSLIEMRTWLIGRILIKKSRHSTWIKESNSEFIAALAFLRTMYSSFFSTGESREKYWLA